ncbi:uncharacterized protein LOC141538109 isoform X2 [Cotesia typhae]
MIPIINKELLAQLQTANLISEQELDDNNLFEEEDMEQDDPIDDASCRQNNDLLKHQETELLQDENEGTGLLSLQDLEASDKDNLIPPEPELHPTRSFVTHELLNYEQTHSDQCCETCRLMLSLILHTVTELKEKINYAPTLSNYNSQIVLDNTNTNLLPKYPIKKVEKFEELDKKLKESDKFKAAFKADISKLGGKNPQKATKAILGYLFANKFASASSWSGIHGGVKIKDTALVQVLIEFLVGKYGGTFNETKDDVENRIKDWFQRGSERLKAEKKERLKKKEKEYLQGDAKDEA